MVREIQDHVQCTCIVCITREKNHCNDLEETKEVWSVGVNQAVPEREHRQARHVNVIVRCNVFVHSLCVRRQHSIPTLYIMQDVTNRKSLDAQRLLTVQ